MTLSSRSLNGRGFPLSNPKKKDQQSPLPVTSSLYNFYLTPKSAPLSGLSFPCFSWMILLLISKRSWIDGFFSFPGIFFFCATAFLSAFPASLTAVFSLLHDFVFNFGFSSFEHELKMSKRTSLSQKRIWKKSGRKSYGMDPCLNMSFESGGISTPFKDLSWNEQF